LLSAIEAEIQSFSTDDSGITKLKVVTQAEYYKVKLLNKQLKKSVFEDVIIIFKE
jgi:hypothetical protein